VDVGLFDINDSCFANTNSPEKKQQSQFCLINIGCKLSDDDIKSRERLRVDGQERSVAGCTANTGKIVGSKVRK
jgi:hypothetical protein